jgi:mannose-1-phosphate guanylyltransferase
VTLLRATVERVLPTGAEVHIVTSAAQVEGCRDAVRGLPPVEVIAEPEARGTGPALALAVRWIARSDPAALVCSVHADHHVGDANRYRAALWAAAGWAAVGDGLVTVGLVPTHPATGLGYVAVGEPRRADEWVPPAAEPPGGGGEMTKEARALPAYAAAGFVEKPARDVALGFVESGSHLWNTGLFAWSAAALEREVAAFAAEVADGVAATVAARVAGDEDAASRRYAALTAVAIDPMVLERTSRLTVVRASFPWSDLGSWSDLYAARLGMGLGDDDANVVSGDALTVDSRDCLVDSRGGRSVAVVGADGLVVVDTGDAVLVVPRARAQQVRDAVERLRLEGRDSLL